MILWRHRDEAYSGWVYYATKSDGELARGRYMAKHKMNTQQRREYNETHPLERIEVWHPDGKQAMAKLMNKIEGGATIQWLR